eukprot:TRINITY_DN43110_c0_g1_i1.p1 TRINITY_DN43110_c0_g1~~TRINITY_DN43110_c0_g1_i1.p1  ORF type:complete len:555 (+),score=159.32 TRINITY_DN43110_c0_g1_i1:56-1666(+)
MAAPVDGLGVRPADVLDEGTLRRIARFCRVLQRSDKPKKDVIDDLKALAERAGSDDVIAGAVTRHIKFASGPKLLLCWYLLDVLAKNHPETFGLAFGPQILDLAVHYMNWMEPKEEARYLKLIETWRMLFGDITCEDILRRKEARKVELQMRQEERAALVAKGLPVPAELESDVVQDRPKEDEMALILGGVRDGQVVEYSAPCKYYLLGVCQNPNCPRPHPKGQFGSVSADKCFSDWKCLRCGYENPANQKQCWRRDCVGTKPEDLYIPRQVRSNAFREQFGYDPTEPSEAVEHFKSRPSGAQWRAERRKEYTKAWQEWRRRPVDMAAVRESRRAATLQSGAQQPSEKTVVRACVGCGAPMRHDAVFCTRCGARQQTASGDPMAAPGVAERDDIYFPSTRMAQPESVQAHVSATAAELLHACSMVITTPDPGHAHLAAMHEALVRTRSDPRLSSLPPQTLAPVLRAVSRVWSRWCTRQDHRSPAAALLREFVSLRPSFPISEIDDSAFNGIAAVVMPAAGPRLPPPGPAPGASVSL